MIALLIGVIMHSIHLSQSLKTFQTLHREIKPMLKEHTSSISNSAKYVDQLRTLMRDVNQTIQTKTPEVQMLKQDLEFMTNRANQVADYLEKLLQEARVMGIANQYFNRKLDVEDDNIPQTTTSHASIKPEETEQTPITQNNQKAIIKRLRQKIGQQKPKAPTTKAQQEKSEPFLKNDLTKKLTDKLREKHHAA
jgi:argonaute-like protein implicated in RNA metabolism and viral defense